MKKRITGLILAVVILVSALPVTVRAAASLKTSVDAIRILKFEEGFSKKPYWDYSQWTVGYGTRCPDDKLERYKAYGITEAEAEALLKTYIAGFEKELNQFIAKTGVRLTQNQYDALLLLTYNCGSKWMYTKTGMLYNAVVSGASGNALVDAFARWCHAGGEVKTFLLRRRLSEANMYLNGIYSQEISQSLGYVIFDPRGGSITTDVQGYDVSLTSPIIPVPTYAGYTFLGWYTQPVGGKKVTVLDATVRNTKLYAQWHNGSTAPPPAEENPQILTGKVKVKSRLRVRSGPGTSSKTVAHLKNGTKVTVSAVELVGNTPWGKIGQGWICLDYVVLDGQTNEPEKVIKTVTAYRLRIRKNAGTKYKTVGYLRKGTKVEILETKKVGKTTWGRISNGWICLSYTK